MLSHESDDLYNRQSITGRRKISVMHYHEDKYELYYLINGTVSYLVGNNNYFMKPGDLILIPPQVPHGTDTQDCMYNERIVLSFHEAEIDEYILNYVSDLCQNHVINLPSNCLPKVDEIIDKIRKEFETSNFYSAHMIRFHLSELLLYLHRNRYKSTPKSQDIKTVVQEVSQYIFDHYNEDLSLETLSQKTNLSEFYLSRKFKADTGISISEYINYVRITNAKKLLKEPFSTITEVAFACGYNDSSYFTATFKKFTGMTPLKFSKTPSAPFEKKGPILEQT